MIILLDFVIGNCKNPCLPCWKKLTYLVKFQKKKLSSWKTTSEELLYRNWISSCALFLKKLFRCSKTFNSEHSRSLMKSNGITKHKVGVWTFSAIHVIQFKAETIRKHVWYGICVSGIKRKSNTRTNKRKRIIQFLHYLKSTTVKISFSITKSPRFKIIWI